MVDVVARHRVQVFMPLTVGGGMRTVADVRRMLDAGADKVSHQHGGACADPIRRGGLSSASARSASWSPSTRKRVEAERRAWEVFTHGGRTPTGLDAIEWARESRNSARAKSC